ncbi:hypothetical protein C2G38_2183279 [Gigaspora rosea]|uniref:Uncharacterized protein n=1 Tax=Gigaspora rosea TaxID=44941 RepID=A0A397V907_9GLOM|nr:hypothetical protein C2G38_2183279 [Gigaspora rosea]
MDEDFNKRPTATEIIEIITRWLDEIIKMIMRSKHGYSVPCIAYWAAKPLDTALTEQLSALFDEQLKSVWIKVIKGMLIMVGINMIEIKIMREINEHNRKKNENIDKNKNINMGK